MKSLFGDDEPTPAKPKAQPAIKPTPAVTEFEETIEDYLAQLENVIENIRSHALQNPKDKPAIADKVEKQLKLIDKLRK